jgi:actin-related protein 5
VTKTQKRLKDAGFSSTEDLDVYLKKIEDSLKRARNKELGVDENEDKGEPTFPLVNVPDATLNEEDLKEKRRQRLMKAGYDARIRAKVEREADRTAKVEASRLDDEERKTDPAGWLRGLRKQHEVSPSSHFNFCSSSTDNWMITSQNAMNRIRDRKKKKEQLTDRKSLAAQQRMKSIATLASEVNVGKKRKRGVAGASLQLAIYIR